MKKDNSDRAQIERLSAFSDNIIAFALTLLALDLTVFKKGLGSVLAFGDLTNLLHPFAAFILSFIVVATLWRIYNELFGFIIKIDSTIIVRFRKLTALSKDQGTITNRLQLKSFRIHNLNIEEIPCSKIGGSYYYDYEKIQQLLKNGEKTK